MPLPSDWSGAKNAVNRGRTATHTPTLNRSPLRWSSGSGCETHARLFVVTPLQVSTWGRLIGSRLTCATAKHAGMMLFTKMTRDKVRHTVDLLVFAKMLSQQSPRYRWMWQVTWQRHGTCYLWCGMLTRQVHGSNLTWRWHIASFCLVRWYESLSFGPCRWIGSTWIHGWSWLSPFGTYKE